MHRLVFVALLVMASSAAVEDDLLDEYVKYVENVHRPRVPAASRVQPSAVEQRRLHRQKKDVAGDSSGDEWTHRQQMDDKGDFVVRWFKKNKEIVFRIEANTTGYVGLGFSPKGNMRDADIVVAWFDNEMGQPVLWDCHGDSDANGAPIRDEVENYNLLGGEQVDRRTVIEFSRLLDTCDDNDYVLGTDTVHMIWAMHDTDPRMGVPLAYHGTETRGSRSVHLLSPPPVAPPSLQDLHVRKWEVTLNNFVVPDNMDTLYWCKIFKSPTLQEKHHIIGYEPVVGTNHTGRAHHMLLYECELGRTPNINEWEAYTKSAGSACYGPFMPRPWEVCLTPVVAWAIGSKGEFLPDHVGLPIAEKANTYYMLEVHFDNPSMERSVGTSGIKVHYTRRLRRHEAGIMVSGVTVSSLHVIPPRQPEYKSAGVCSGDCTSAMFPERGINIISVLLHSHLAGKRLSLRHIRNGEELPKITEDNNYDFDYQQTRVLKKERVVFPGDTLITECVYNTKRRTRPTVGGYSTKQEMCLAFVLHYPRTQLAGCYSMAPIKKFFEIFGVKEFYDNDMKKVEEIFLGTAADSTIVTPKPSQQSLGFSNGASTDGDMKHIKDLQQGKWYTIDGDPTPQYGPLSQLIIKKPDEFQNKTFMSHLTELPWEESLLTKRIEESFYKGNHLTFCRKRDDSLALPATVQNFPSFIMIPENATKRQCAASLHLNTAANISTKSLLRLAIAMVIVNIYIF